MGESPLSIIDLADDVRIIHIYSNISRKQHKQLSIGYSLRKEIHTLIRRFSAFSIMLRPPASCVALHYFYALSNCPFYFVCNNILWYIVKHLSRSSTGRTWYRIIDS